MPWSRDIAIVGSAQQSRNPAQRHPAMGPGSAIRPPPARGSWAGRAACSGATMAFSLRLLAQGKMHLTGWPRLGRKTATVGYNCRRHSLSRSRRP